MASSFVGGILGKLAAKYGMLWKWRKAVALGKRITGLELAGAVDDGCKQLHPET
ncbi:hypothetical protein [Streptomyces sp. NPDC056672]|uniref:hypothetical protein n=1 Tax=Streptomyces sp. NPDC056672 TaxID=3345906 RepID=UPI0036B05BC8